MKCNVGKTDQAFRVIVAIVIAAIAYYTKINWLYLVAIIPLITGLINFCPLYTIFGMNTCESKKVAKPAVIKKTTPTKAVKKTVKKVVKKKTAKKKK